MSAKKDGELCMKPPAHCVSYKPTQSDIEDIVRKTGLKLHEIQPAFSDTPTSEKGRGLGPAQQDIAATTIIILIAGGMSILTSNAAASFLVAIRVLPSLCPQNMVVHATRKLMSQFGLAKTCEDHATAHAARLVAIIGVCGGLGVMSATVRSFFNESHAVVKAVLFGTPKQQRQAAKKLKKAKELAKKTALAKKQTA